MALAAAPAQAAYFQATRAGKAMHDLVAAMDTSVCDFEEVEIYRERGALGARISIGFHPQRFLDVLSR